MSSAGTSSSPNICSISLVKGLLFTGSSLMTASMEEMLLRKFTVTEGSLRRLSSRAEVSSCWSMPLFCPSSSDWFPGRGTRVGSWMG